MASHWFLVWVPSAKEERLERERKSRDRSVSFGVERVEDSSTKNTENGSEDINVKNGENIELNENFIEQNGTTDKFKVTKIEEEHAALTNQSEERTSKVSEYEEDKKLLGEEGDGDDEEVQLRSTLTREDSDCSNSQESNPPQSLSEPSTDPLYQKSVCSKELEPLLDWSPLEEVVRKFLASRVAGTVHVVRTVDGSKTQLSFCVTFDQVEDLSLALQQLGVGHVEESSISIIPISLHCSPTESKQVDTELPSNLITEEKKEKFYASIKSRLLVSEVVARIQVKATQFTVIDLFQAGAEFSFDYLLLVILAGVIAFMGLLESSSVVLVASMLVSPIMGQWHTPRQSPWRLH